MGYPVVHFEIAGRNGEALEEFYSKLFGWEIERHEAGGFPYGFVRTGGEGGIDGGIRHEPEGGAEVVFYVEVPDVSAAIETAEQLGGEVRIPPISADKVTFAIIVDLEGNSVGMIEKK